MDLYKYRLKNWNYPLWASPNTRMCNFWQNEETLHCLDFITSYRPLRWCPLERYLQLVIHSGRFRQMLALSPIYSKPTSNQEQGPGPTKSVHGNGTSTALPRLTSTLVYRLTSKTQPTRVMPKESESQSYVLSLMYAIPTHQGTIGRNVLLERPEYGTHRNNPSDNRRPGKRTFVLSFLSENHGDKST